MQATSRQVLGLCGHLSLSLDSMDYFWFTNFLGPPSNSHSLRVKEESYGSAVLEWSRPYIPGRSDLYYDIYISDSKLSGTYVKFNSYPIVRDSAMVERVLNPLPGIM